MKFNGKIAVVTGASMGIGEAIARSLAAAGCDVVLAARSVDKIDRLAAQLRAEHGVRVLAVPTDVTDRSSVQALFERTQQILGGVDILINNAGLGASGSVADIPEETLRYIFDVNVFGLVQGMQAAIPAMRKRGGGTIVNVGSVVSFLPLPQLGPNGASATYAASKFAMRAFSLAARAELAHENIRVVTVYPGLTRSEFSRNVRRLPGQPPRPKDRPDQEKSASMSAPGLFNRARRAMVIPADKVAQRTLVAIQRNEREVFISWWDRLAAHLVARYPDGFDRLMQWASPALSREPQSPAPPVGREPTAKPNVWVLAGLAGGLVLAGGWLGRRQQDKRNG